VVETLLKDYSHIKLAKVDVDLEPELAEKYQIDSYPTFKMFTKGKIVDYSSDRDEKNMANWILKHSKDIVQNIHSASQLEDLKSSHSVCFVMIGKENSESFKLFFQAALKSPGRCFGLIQDSGIFNYEPKSEASILVFKQADDKFQINVRFENLDEYFSSHLIPWVLPLGDDSILEIFEKGRTGLILFTQDQGALDLLTLLSKDTHDFFQLTFGDLKQAQHEILSKELGIQKLSMPFALIIEGKTKKYLMTKEVNLENLKEFCYLFISGNLKEFWKSEEKLKEDGKIWRFVGNGFDEEVRKVRTLVAFVIPNCGYCRILMPDLEEIAEKNQEIRVGVIDVSLNDVPRVSIEQFPAVAFFSPGENEGRFYKGSLTSEAISKAFGLNT
jgi:thiol-disulfide isomerase/thioredoxin